MIRKISIYNPYYKQSFGNNSANSAPLNQSEKQIKTDNNTDREPVKASILTINDVHGKMTNMERIYAISKQYDRITPKDTDRLKLASGDIILGANYTSNIVANKFLNWDGEGRLYDISLTKKYGWMCTAGMPIKNDEGETVAFVLADITLNEVSRGMKNFLFQYIIAMIAAACLDLAGYSSIGRAYIG
jgi:hypothetical protein